MKPKLLILSGWGPYRDIVEVDFTKLAGRGLFLITGATGSGKTTLFDAVTYALYGNMSGDMREKNSVRSDFADGDTATYTDLVMEHGGKEYRIVRNPEYLRPKKRRNGGGEYTKEKENAVLYMPDGSVIQGCGEVNGKLQEILVLDYRQFRQISMIAQGDFARLLTASPSEKTKIFREIFATNACERFTGILRGRSSELYKQVMEYRHRMEEDVHMLQTEEAKDNALLSELLSGERYPFEKVLTCLELTKRSHKDSLQKAEKEYLQYEMEISAIAKKISQGEQINATLCKLNKSLEEWRLLGQQKKDIAEKEKELKKVKAAFHLKSDYIRCKNEANQLAVLLLKEEKVQKEIKQLQEEGEKNLVLYENREKLRAAYRYKINYMEKQTAREEIYALLIRKEKELCNLKEKYLEQEYITERNKKEYESADKAYKRAAVGIAAKQLEAGKPCPVCGSLEHPHPADILEVIPDEDTLQKLQDVYEIENKKLQELHGKTAACMGELKEKAIQEKEAAIQVQIWEKKLAQVEEDVLRITESIPLETYEARMTGYETLQAQLGGKQDLHTKLIEEISVQKKITEEVNAWFTEKYTQQGFKSTEDYERNLRNSEEMDILEKEIEAYRGKVQALLSVVKHLKEESKGKQEVDLDSLLRESEKKSKDKKQALEEQTKWNHRLQVVTKLKKSLSEKWERFKKLSSEYGILKDLDHLASGNNPKRLVFEQYVLAGYFEEILRAANLRLAKMTNGRYELSRLKEVGDGRIRDNLEIQVLDYYTGKYRSVKTLSGGEAFKASLSLALGMSDVIQGYSGGIRVETLFIDEGFGSLDSESLEQACQTLMSLVEKDRMIGIISHVPELSEKIEKQIVITKTKVGSKVEIVV